MNGIGELQLDDNVSTEGTNWEFVGTTTHPSWKNTRTGHLVLIEESDTAQFDCQVRLNHKKQLQPWWTLMEETLTESLIPRIEWILSSPEEHLSHRELIAENSKPV